MGVDKLLRPSVKCNTQIFGRKGEPMGSLTEGPSILDQLGGLVGTGAKAPVREVRETLEAVEAEPPEATESRKEDLRRKWENVLGTGHQKIEAVRARYRANQSTWERERHKTRSAYEEQLFQKEGGKVSRIQEVEAGQACNEEIQEKREETTELLDQFRADTKSGRIALAIAEEGLDLSTQEIVAVGRAMAGEHVGGVASQRAVAHAAKRAIEVIEDCTVVGPEPMARELPWVRSIGEYVVERLQSRRFGQIHPRDATGGCVATTGKLLVVDVNTALGKMAGQPAIIEGKVPDIQAGTYGRLRDTIKSIVERQQRLLGWIQKEADRNLDKWLRGEKVKVGPEEKMRHTKRQYGNEAALGFLRVMRGDPENRGKVPPENERVRERVEMVRKKYTNGTLRDFVDRPLYFSIDSGEVQLQAKGREDIRRGLEANVDRDALRNVDERISDLKEEFNRKLERMEGRLEGTFDQDEIYTLESEIKELEKEYSRRSLNVYVESTRWKGILEDSRDLIRAFLFFERGEDYHVEDGQVALTRRVWEGRGKPIQNGLRQGIKRAIEAKEDIQSDRSWQMYEMGTVWGVLTTIDQTIGGVSGDALTQDVKRLYDGEADRRSKSIGAYLGRRGSMREKDAKDGYLRWDRLLRPYAERMKTLRRRPFEGLSEIPLWETTYWKIKEIVSSGTEVEKVQDRLRQVGLPVPIEYPDPETRQIFEDVHRRHVEKRKRIGHQIRRSIEQGGEVIYRDRGKRIGLRIEEADEVDGRSLGARMAQSIWLRNADERWLEFMERVEHYKGGAGQCFLLGAKEERAREAIRNDFEEIMARFRRQVVSDWMTITPEVGEGADIFYLDRMGHPEEVRPLRIPREEERYDDNWERDRVAGEPGDIVMDMVDDQREKTVMDLVKKSLKSAWTMVSRR